MDNILAVSGVSKTYASGVTALHSVDLGIRKGEIFALLGPNGAGKTTLISIICGIVTPSSGTITVRGHDAQKDWRPARKAIGLVPQETSVDMFETVLATVKYSRRLFGKSANEGIVDAGMIPKVDSAATALKAGVEKVQFVDGRTPHSVLLEIFTDAGIGTELVS